MQRYARVVRAEPSPLSVAMTVEQVWQPAPGGSGTYVSELARALAERSDVRLLGLAARRSGPESLPLPPSMTVHHSPLPRPALYELWSRNRRRRPASDRAVVRSRRGPDVLHATTWAIPPRTAPLVVTIHDVAFLRDPSHFTARGNAFFRRALRIAQDEADVVVVPSDVTASDCVAHGIERSRIRVVPHGVRAPAVAEHDALAFRLAHGLDRPYVMWCGTLEPRKNLGTLLDAYRAVADEVPDLDLVLVGPRGWGGSAGEVEERVGLLPAGRTHLLGRLGLADLHRAYAGARAFCFPSLWEGFGMPVLEAMAHGIPVVTSAGTSMAEISPAGAILVDAHSPDDVAEALIAASGPRHDELSAAATANAARFSWDRSADLHVEAYRAATGDR